MYNNKVSCGSGGTGRRARLRGVWFYRTGSIPVSRTNKKRRVLVALLFLLSRSGCTRFALYAKYKIKPKVSNFTLKHNCRRANRVHIPPSAVFCAVRRYTKALDKNPAQQIPVSAVSRPCGSPLFVGCARWAREPRFALDTKYKINALAFNFALKHNHRRANRVHIPPSAVFCLVRTCTKALDILICQAF